LSFQSDIRQEFGDILAAEFSARIVFHLDSGDWDTTGIYDETFEEIATNENGQPVMSKIARVTVFWDDLPSAVSDYTLVTVYPDPESLDSIEYKIDGAGIESESEGNALIRLTKL